MIIAGLDTTYNVPLGRDLLVEGCEKRLKYIRGLPIVTAHPSSGIGGPCASELEQGLGGDHTVSSLGSHTEQYQQPSYLL